MRIIKALTATINEPKNSFTAENLQKFADTAVGAPITIDFDNNSCVGTIFSATVTDRGLEVMGVVDGNIESPYLYLVPGFTLPAYKIITFGLTPHPCDSTLSKIQITKSLPQLQQEIGEWADKLIPNRTAHNALTKMVMEEIPELIAGGLADPLEIADIGILLLDVAYLQGVNIEQAIEDKMNINRGRDWDVDKNTGLMHHK